MPPCACGARWRRAAGRSSSGGRATYRIRLHGRGGHGVLSAARILGSAFFAEGFEAQDAPRFGAERRGAPLFAGVRASRRPIRERGRVRRPDLVAVTDDRLLAVAAAGVLLDLDAHTWLLLLSDEEAPVWERRLARGRILTLSAGAPGRADVAALGARCAGAAARLVGCIGRATLEHALGLELAKVAPEGLAASRRAALGAFDEAAPHAGCVEEGPDVPPDVGARPAWVELPLERAALSAPDVTAARTSTAVQTGLWRTQRPVIDDALCHRCAWICSTFCPDGAISIAADGRPAIDYDHCKGCLVCAAVCPPHAIRVEPERAAAGAREERP